MTELLQQFSEQQTAGFILVLARLSPLFILAPLFSSRSIPRRVRGIVAVALALGLAPLALRDHTIPLEIAAFTELVAKELVVGLAFAFAVGAILAAVSVAGSLLDTVMGYAFGAVVDPMNGSQAAVLGQLYSLVTVMVFIAVGGDRWVIEGLARTYELVPLLDVPSIGRLVDGAVTVLASIFVSAIQVAAPVILALVITDAGFGIVSRVVPQMNVFAVGFPSKIIVGLLIVAASLPFVAGWIADELERTVVTAVEVVS